MSRNQSLSAFAKARQPDVKRAPSIIRSKSTVMSVVLAMAVSLIHSCGATRPSKYYQLTPSVNPSSATTATIVGPFPVTLIVGRIKASHLYREDRIVYSGRGEEMGTYEYQRWTEPPTEMMEETLLRALRASGHYEGVASFAGESRGDFLLRGQLLDFKEVSGEPLAARMTLELELHDSKSGTTVWTRTCTHDEPLRGNDISAVVAALNRNVQRCVAEVGTSLDEYFKSHTSK